jgi:hypothetical protein
MSASCHLRSAVNAGTPRRSAKAMHARSASESPCGLVIGRSRATATQSAAVSGSIVKARRDPSARRNAAAAASGSFPASASLDRTSAQLTDTHSCPIANRLDDDRRAILGVEYCHQCRGVEDRRRFAFSHCGAGDPQTRDSRPPLRPGGRRSAHRPSCDLVPHRRKVPASAPLRRGGGRPRFWSAWSREPCPDAIGHFGTSVILAYPRSSNSRLSRSLTNCSSGAARPSTSSLVGLGKWP